MSHNRKAFDAGLSNEHPVERITVMCWQTFQRVDMLDSYGKPVEGLFV